MKNIVILGAGFGGLRAALGLAKKLKKNSEYRVILIDKNSYHTYTPSLYEVATAYRGGRLRASAREQDFEEELAGSSCFIIGDVIDGTRITFIQDEIVDIDLETRSIITRADDSITFEYCVIALGSEATFFGVEGAHVCCSSMKTLTDALHIREHVETIFKNFFTAQKEEIKLITIGAGFSGFEITTELAKYADHLARAYEVSRSRVKIILIEAANSVLPQAPPSMQKKAQRRLEKLGITFMTNMRIARTAPHKVIFEDGQEVTADFILWGGGIKGPSLFKEIRGLALHKSGKIFVDKYLRVRGQKNVFGIGDSSYFYDKRRKHDVPSTAWAAEQGADLVIKNINALMRGEALQEYRVRFPGFVSAAGGKYAIAHLFGVTIAGLPAWILKRLIDLKYILSLFPLFRGLSLWFKGLDLFTRND